MSSFKSHASLSVVVSVSAPVKEKSKSPLGRLILGNQQLKEELQTDALFIASTKDKKAASPAAGASPLSPKGKPGQSVFLFRNNITPPPSPVSASPMMVC